MQQNFCEPKLNMFCMGGVFGGKRKTKSNLLRKTGEKTIDYNTSVIGGMDGMHERQERVSMCQTHDMEWASHRNSRDSHAGLQLLLVNARD